MSRRVSCVAERERGPGGRGGRGAVVHACPLVAMLALTFGTPLTTAGCARPETAADKNAAAMRDTLSRIQADQDRMDQRLGALELALADERSAHQPEPRASSSRPTPPLRVVQIGPSDEAQSDGASEAGEAGERPDIRVVGAPSPVRAARGTTRSGRGKLDIVASGGDGSSAGEGARPSALDPEARRSYDAALALVNGKQYDRALEGLAAFLVRWPDHPYAENALYWRGEVYYARSEYQRAAEQFEAVVARFGTGNKAADALLKLGMCHDRLGDTARAQEYWSRVKSEYPRSEAARKIPAAPRDPAAAPRAAGRGPKESG